MSAAEFPKRYKFKEHEAELQKSWQSQALFAFKPEKDQAVFSIDTPPPTVSGHLHIGHVFSYTHQDVIARYKRLQGLSVYYPMGFDGNGLPSERLTEKDHDLKGSDLPRSEFIKLCFETTESYIQDYRQLFESLGFSCDWDLKYSTIDPRSIAISQRSFVDLHQKNEVLYQEEPTLWCPECQTSFAQAEVDTKELPSTFNDLSFSLKEGGRITIATTRPELLPACGAVLVHPDDERYRDQVGKHAVVPLFGHEVPVIADPDVDREKGSGAVMCCTFGDKTDLVWWHRHSLELRKAISADGKMTELAQDFAGLSINKARRAILERCENEGLLLKQEKIVHPVNTHERCGTPQEFLTTKQWFVQVLKHKERLKEAADQITWYPDHMKHRYLNWVDHLEWDWCISRQRFFGVPFPLWHCGSCGEVKVAAVESLPVDPLTDQPGETCSACGAKDWQGEKDVMDTWATSSVTPQINQQWGLEKDRGPSFMPMSLRPQAHDIIRTWAFYTITKSILHGGTVPWSDIMISGHVMAKTPKGQKKQKISKSKSNTKGSPAQLLEEWGADVVRYWAASAKLGSDYDINEDDFRTGKSLVNKIWNASKFGLTFISQADHTLSQDLESVDQWILYRLQQTLDQAAAELDRYEYGLAKNVIERFFWGDVCDNYLEIAKSRLYGEGGHSESAQASGRSTLYQVLKSVLIMFSPYLPHVTDRIWSLSFADWEGLPHLGQARWPALPVQGANPELELFNEIISTVVATGRRFKTEQQISLRAPLKTMSVTATEAQIQALECLKGDLCDVLNLKNLEISKGQGLTVNDIQIEEATT